MNHGLSTMPGALRRTAIAAALALGGILPATAAIVTLGDVNPNPGSGVVGILGVGNNAAGSVTVNGGSSLLMERLVLGGGPAGNGTMTVTGAGSKGTVTFGNNANNVDVGGAGAGSLQVLNGASFVYGDSSTACQLNCRIFVSNGAGSSGNVLVQGAGSSLSAVGGVFVGHASVFTMATAGYDYGQPGGASSGSVTVKDGATVSSSFLAVSQPGGGSAPTGAESTTGTVILDGVGSLWTLVRNAAQTGSQALLGAGSGRNTSGSVEVRNGAVMKLDGSSAPSLYSGINLAAVTAGSTTSNAHASLTVTGAGSRVEVDGGVGFLNVGRGNGASAALTVSDGGVITSSGTERGLTYLTIGNGGGTGSATISGTGSLVRLNGRNSATNTEPSAVLNAGAFLAVGTAAGGSGGHGTMTINNGGRLEVDTSALALTNANGQTGMYVGAFGGSTGQLTVSGPGSTLLISAGTGMTPYVGIGRDSGSGSLLISNGGVVEVSSLHTSVPNIGSNVYLPGDLNNFEIGRSVSAGATSGSVTVTGAGSKLLLSGNADGFIQVGRGANANGSLTIASGGQTRSNVVFIGTEAGNGVLNMDAGHMVIDGMLKGGPSAGSGGSLVVGRGGGTGVANIANGSTISISSSAPNPSLSIGGSGTAPGGTGTVNVSGGSTLTVDGPDATIVLGRAAANTGPAIGTLTLSGAGTSVSATGSNARVLMGRTANGTGTVTVGADAALSATALIGVAHDGTASTGGVGTLVVNGTATAAALKIGSNGLVGGNGVINADVTNQGVINPGNSPGKLMINGAFDNSDGKIVLEVQSLGNGQFAMDELVFSDWSKVFMGDGEIEFVFLGATDPTAFQDAGLFGLGSFFKQVDGNGNEAPLDDSLLALFTDTNFSASAAQFAITALSFNPLTGAFNATVGTAVPLPAPLLLMLLAFSLLALQRRRAAR
ncbi:MAG: hypothetical protein LCI02_13060 [Proteobacteria bacterium]|nr:hypothetical protein [Pseudomonadota bacterium]